MDIVLPVSLGILAAVLLGAAFCFERSVRLGLLGAGTLVASGAGVAGWCSWTPEQPNRSDRGAQMAKGLDAVPVTPVVEGKGGKKRDLKPSKYPLPDPLPEATKNRLSQFETSLQALHANAVGRFVDADGFGGGRMPVFRDSTLALQGKPPEHLWSTEDLETEPKVGAGELSRIHLGSALDFSFLAKKGPQAGGALGVAATSHESHRAPRSWQWDVKALDLVGLVVNDEPVAYVSKSLPRMEELRDSKTRELDVFEKVGLEKLANGEDVFVRQAGQNLRVLGALRAAAQCVDCHGGQRGDLLGAFSYTLGSRVAAINAPLHKGGPPIP